MQVSNVSGVSFSKKLSITPEELEARALALQDEDIDIDSKLNPELLADMLDGKLKKTEKGRKLINTIASCAGFAAAALSFKKVAPSVRKGISSATSKVAKSVSNIGSKVNNKNIQEIANGMGDDAQKIAQKGTGELLQRTVKRVLGDKKGQSALHGMEKVGIKTGADLADTTFALFLAALSGHEFGDRVDGIQKEAQKEASLKDTVKDFAKIAGAFSGADVIPEV